jgi:hypothetical protein
VSQGKSLEAGSYLSVVRPLFSSKRKVMSMSRKFLKIPKGFLVAAAPLLLMLGACGSDDTSSSDTAASTAGDVRQLTFTGSDCVSEGPAEVTAGVVTVELVNDSDGGANMFVGLLEEGMTFQDFVDEAGSEPFTPSSVSGLTLFDMGGFPPAGAGETLHWEKSLAAGEYITNCNQAGNIWFGGGFTVVNG